MKSWLKGGLIGLVVGTVLLGLFFGFVKDSEACVWKGENPVICTVYSIIALPVTIVAVVMWAFAKKDVHLEASISNYVPKFIIYNLIFFFLVGAIMGLIVGKIKQKVVVVKK